MGSPAPSRTGGNRDRRKSECVPVKLSSPRREAIGFVFPHLRGTQPEEVAGESLTLQRLRTQLEKEWQRDLQPVLQDEIDEHESAVYFRGIEKGTDGQRVYALIFARNWAKEVCAMPKVHACCF